MTALAACIPSQKGKQQATCGENEAFDPIKRTCYSVYIPPLPPVPTLSSVDLDGETATSVTLTYTDNKKELARFCSVISGANLTNTACTCVSGVCTTTLTSDYLFFGQTTFSYTVSDDDGTSSSRTVTVNVTPKNHAPVTSSDVLAVTEDTPASATASATDVDTSLLNIGVLTYEVVSQGSKGTVTMNQFNGAYTYTPSLNLNGSDSFTFRVRDNGQPPLYSNTSTVSVTISAVNDAPVINLSTQAFSGVFNTALTATLGAGTDIDGDTLSYSTTASPTFGVLSSCLGIAGVAGLVCTYTPNANVSDDDRYAQLQIGGLHYVAKSYGPGGNNIHIHYVADASAPGSETVSVSGNDITIHIASSGKSTSAQVKAAIESSSSASALVGVYIRGSIYEVAGDYVLADGRYYTDTFSYRASDGLLNSSSSASVTISIPNANSAPVVGAAQTATLDENTTSVFVLNLATDRNYKDSLVYTAVDVSNLHGTLTGCGNATNSLICSYKPDKNYNGVGAASFTYRAVDSTSLNSATQTVTFNIADVPQAPMLCQYSSFEEANECGYQGCVGTASPLGNIMPSKSGLYYYQKDVAICWRSVGTGINDWVDNEVGRIADQSINEKDQAIIDTIRIDEGGGSGENAELIQVETATITKVSGDNGLLNSSSILFYHNSATVTLGSNFGGATSEDEADFKIVINPVSGKSGVAKVDLVLKDTNAATTAVTFFVTVNASSAQHKGWADVQAIGPKVSKDGDLRNPTYPCNYSRYHCDISSRTRQACKGAFVPTATTASTSDQYAIFYNTAANKCYYNSSAVNATANWVEFSSVCNISSSYGYSGFTGKASLVGTTTPVGNIAPVNLNDSYYDLTNNICYRSIGLTNLNWETYSQTTPVTISWDSYQVSGSGVIEGYNVYRRLAGSSFDYKKPINKTVLSASATSYVDNASNSWFAPIPRTAYEYEVRPVINSISTAAYGYTQTIKVSVPDNNMALVHRWIANKVMCDKLHSTVETNNNYRCVYQGPGDNGAGFYDAGFDFFVDVYEAGCNYSSSPVCDTPDGTCIGLTTPNGNITSTGAAYFYDRGEGKCYYTDTGLINSWVRVNGSQNFTHNFPELPPAVYMTQEEANTFCGNKTVTNILGSTNINTATGTLPNRKLQMLYSDWSSSLTNSAITTYEAGQALNSSPKCNSNSANGLTGYFTDANIPDSSSFYTLPGSISSLIRSFITGSTKTSTCQSRYGVQDAVGNVSEWVKDRFKCTKLGTCEGVVSTTTGVAALDTTNTMLGLDTSGSFQYKVGDSYGPYGTPFYPSGPCSDTDSDGVCNSYLTSWILSDGDYSAGRIWIPMGLPSHVNFNSSSYSTSAVVPWNLIIGNSSGIIDEALHDDRVHFNTQAIYADTPSATYGCGAMATGGSYKSGSFNTSAAGVYNFDLIPCSGSFGYLLIGDVSFKAKNSLVTNPVYIELISDGAAGGGVTTATSTSGSNRLITVHLSTDGSSASTTAASINATAGSWVYADVVGLDATVQSAVSSTAMVDISSYTPSRSDVGFRCIYKLP